MQGNQMIFLCKSSEVRDDSINEELSSRVCH